jgi:MFS family permease
MSHCVLEESAHKPTLRPPVGRNKTSSKRSSLYYGWIMLPISMVTLIASAPGQTFGVSIFNEPMRLSLGLSHSQLSAAYMLGTLLGAIPITFIGHQMDKRGLRQAMLAVVTLFSIACLITATVNGWLMLVIAFCFLRMLGPGALAFLSGNTLSFWFERRLGTVEGVRQLGMAAAMIAIPTLNLWLVNQMGWRGAYAVLGVAIWVVLFPLVALLFRNHPTDVGQQFDGTRDDVDNFLVATAASTTARVDTVSTEYWGLTLSQAMRTGSFWIVAGGTAAFSLILTAVFFCLAPLLEERGLSAKDAAATLTTCAACMAVMQLSGGMLADRLRAPYLMFIGMAGLSVSMLLLHRANTATSAMLAGGAMGIAQGLYFGTTHPLWARYFGRRHLGKIRGMLMTLAVASSAVGPFFAGTTRDWLGSFDLAMAVFIIAPLPIAVLSLLATPPSKLAG